MLNRSLTEAGWNDDLIADVKFTEAFSGLIKDTAPGSVKVQYSDVKNLSEDDKSKLFTMFGESLTMGQVPED